MAKSKKVYKYFVSATWVLVETNKAFNYVTQLYQVGVYFIMNNNSGMQANLTPSDLVKLRKQLNKELENGIIKDLVFGRSISVSDETGLWKEIEK